MKRSDAQSIVKNIRGISPYIRFVGVVNQKGKLMAYERRAGLKPLLNTKKTSNQFSHLATHTGMVAQFNKQLGKPRFLWEERSKVQTISFAIGGNTVWLSIDKMVVRSEVLRIIDNCFPIVKIYQ